ncbi:MAG: hypothetical protein IJR08_02395 [Bacilli bacterium]|nr:hypothetical protein [Bacilli bacterium]
MDKKYVLNHSHKICLNENQVISNTELIDSINLANSSIGKIDAEAKKLNINIFELLGMRNLSGFVGEVLVSSIETATGGKFVRNMHQDGYPDLMLNDTQDKKDYLRTTYVIKNNKIYPKDKALFSPYKFGGLEVKATCGSTPSASKAPKPLIGEQRISLINSFDWKAHHRTTNNLIGVLWDFIEDIPTIVAVFYRNDLIIDDWGKIVQPKDGGGRTTSVSIMSSGGVKKMCDGWVAVIDDSQYINKLSAEKWIGRKVK